jgi:hypothetical protein
MFQAHRKKQTTLNYRKQMSKPANGNNYGIFKHYDSAYLKWLKDQLDRRESRDKILSYRNDIIEANKRVNYRNQIDRLNNEIQRDNLNHNSLEHLQHQINQFRNLSFT